MELCAIAAFRVDLFCAASPFGVRQPCCRFSLDFHVAPRFSVASSLVRIALPMHGRSLIPSAIPCIEGPATPSNLPQAQETQRAEMILAGAVLQRVRVSL